MTNWAWPEITRSQKESSIGNITEYSGKILGRGGILTNESKNLGENGEFHLEFDVIQTATTNDWIGFAIGRSSSDPSNFGWNSDCFNFYYGNSGSGTQVCDNNLSVGGWLPGSYTVSSILAEGRHVSIMYNVGKGIYKLESSKKESETIVHEQTGLKFTSTDNIFMGITTSSDMTIKVDNLHFYIVLEKKEYVTINLIDEIGEVELTDNSFSKIDKARKAYDELTQEQKNIISNYSTLVEAENTYKKLEKSAKQNAKNVIDFIEAIGTVELNSESETLISKACEEYEKIKTSHWIFIASDLFFKFIYLFYYFSFLLQWLL